MVLCVTEAFFYCFIFIMAPTRRFYLSISKCHQPWKTLDNISSDVRGGGSVVIVLEEKNKSEKLGLHKNTFTTRPVKDKVVLCGEMY